MQPTPVLLIAICSAVAIALAQIIGPQRFSIGVANIVLLPLVFSFLFGLLLNPNVTIPLRAVFGAGAGARIARLVAPSVMPLVVVLSASIGANIDALVNAGGALLAQELGNLGTMALSMPLAVLGFKMGREAIGATFSIAREAGLAYIFDKYGAKTPEAAGVMAVYICGTFFGAVTFAVFPPLIASLDLFDIRALALACGSGSASMTGACAASISSEAPEHAGLIAALAAGSNLMTNVTGLFITIFVTIPIAEVYFRVLTGTRLGLAAKAND